jgi:predicted TIM-barrel fold metal-dependent hydrolase
MTENGQNTANSADAMDLCDPHFHLWDVPNRPNPNLGMSSTYLASDYQRDMAHLPTQLRLVSGLHVETVVGQIQGGFPIDTVDETRWVCSQLEPVGRPFGVVAYVHLARDTQEAERTIEQHKKISNSRLRGVRMILNHHPSDASLTWPQVEHGHFFSEPLFREGLALLEKHDLSFDLSCHPHQVADAVAVLRDFPAVRVVVNHLGFLHDGEDEAHEALWRTGQHALAELPNVYMKLSMLWFGRSDYHQDAPKEAKIRALVRETIEIFGSERCMFASNYPVDRAKGIDIATLYGQFLAWTADLSQTERTALFHDTAIRAYGSL